MSNYLPFIVAGLATGSVYGIAGMGLVLTYKTSGIFNFAHGAIAAAAAYVFYELHDQHGLPWPIALVVAVIGFGAVAGLVLERFATTLRRASLSMAVVATVGLLLAVQGAASYHYGASTLQTAQFLPTDSLHIAGTTVGADQLIALLVGAASAVALYLFFRVSHLGLSMRAVVDNSELLALGGAAPTRVRRSSWFLGCCFAALSGVLIAPNLGLDPVLLTLLVVQAFGAAAIGTFSSLPMTYVGGLIVGVAASLATKFTGDIPQLNGLPPSVPFIVLFFTLLLLPKGKLVSFDTARLVRARATTASRTLQRSGIAVLGGALVVIPFVVGARLPVYTNGLIFVLVFLSLQLLVGTSNQVSLCQAAFAAVGAAAFSHLTTGLGLPWPVALLLAGLVAVPVGALVAIPAIRLSGLYLAIATFGFGILLQSLVYPLGLMFGSTGSVTVPRPKLGPIDLTSDRAFYFVVLAFVAVGSLLMVVILRTRLGRLLRGVADAPTALATRGTNVNVTLVLVFCISAFTAAIAGGLFGALTGSINGNGFGPFQSLTWLAVLAISGRTRIVSSFVAGFLLAVVPTYFTDPAVADLFTVLFGVSAIGYALTSTYDFRASPWWQRISARAEARGERSPARDRLLASEPAS